MEKMPLKKNVLKKLTLDNETTPQHLNHKYNTYVNQQEYII